MPKDPSSCRPTIQTQDDALKPRTKKQAQDQITVGGGKGLESDGQSAVSRTPNVPRLRVTEVKGRSVPLPDCPDLHQGFDLLKKEIGGADLHFVNDLMWQLADAATRHSVINEQHLAFMMSIVTGMKPRDRLEAMLVAQMAAVHLATMEFAAHLGAAETLLHVDSYERALNKLVRTFTTQIETLKRYRSDGEKPVTVQTVSISEGGQAIVGNVTQKRSCRKPRPRLRRR